MSKKKNTTYIELELKFLESKLKELKEYIKDNPFDKLDDREVSDGRGGTKIAATKEAQRKDLTSALKEYSEILQTVDKLREKEELKVTARGNKKLSLMERKFSQREL